MTKLERKNDQLKGAVVLAGGDSKRLGQPKALLDFNGRVLIEIVVETLSFYFHEITVVTDRPELYSFLPVRFTGDLLDTKQKSPLRGIHAGLSSSTLPYQFVVACDMPFVNLDLIKYMSGFAASNDAVVPRISKHYQPLHAFYKRSCIDIIERQVAGGYYKVTDFYRHIKVKYIAMSEINRFDPGQRSFININTMEDYEKSLELMASRRDTK